MGEEDIPRDARCAECCPVIDISIEYKKNLGEESEDGDGEGTKTKVDSDGEAH